MKRNRNEYIEQPDVFLFARQMYIGENGIGYSKKHFNLMKIDDRLMIVGDVPVWGEDSDGNRTVVSSRVKPITEFVRMT